MPVRYSIQDGVLTMELAGTYESLDIMRAFLEAMKDPNCPNPAPLLVDVSASESLATRPAEEIRMVAQFLGPYAARIGGRCAVVAPAAVQFGLSQMGAVHAERVGVTVQAFRTREQALQWLKSE
jgi:hypothetical protein